MPGIFMARQPDQACSVPGWQVIRLPAETLWTLVDEPIVNQHIADLATLEAIISQRCVDLAGQPDRIKSQTRFHWWPVTAKPN